MTSHIKVGFSSEERLIDDAIEKAAFLHYGQVRKGTRIPYISHLIRVATILIEHGHTDEVVAAGILHDSLEDTDGTIAGLIMRFGEDVAEWILAVTEIGKLSEIDSGAWTWKNRKTLSLESLRENTPIQAIWIFAADKLDNLRSIHEDLQKQGNSIWNRFNAPKEDQKWYYSECLSVIIGYLHVDKNLHVVADEIKNLLRMIWDDETGHSDT